MPARWRSEVVPPGLWWLSGNPDLHWFSTLTHSVRSCAYLLLHLIALDYSHYWALMAGTGWTRQHSTGLVYMQGSFMFWQINELLYC